MAGGVAALMAQRAAKEGRRQQMAFNAAQARAQQQWQQQQAEAARSDKWKRFGMGFLADLAKGLIGEYMPSRIAARSAAEEQQRLAREQAGRAGVRSAQDTARFLATAGLTDAMKRATPTEMGLEYKPGIQPGHQASEAAPALPPPPGLPAPVKEVPLTSVDPSMRRLPQVAPWQAQMPPPSVVPIPPPVQPAPIAPRAPAAPPDAKRGGDMGEDRKVRRSPLRLKTPAGAAGVPDMTVQQLAREIARKKEADEKKAADLRAEERLETRKDRAAAAAYSARKREQFGRRPLTVGEAPRPGTVGDRPQHYELDIRTKPSRGLRRRKGKDKKKGADFAKPVSTEGKLYLDAARKTFHRLPAAKKYASFNAWYRAEPKAAGDHYDSPMVTDAAAKMSASKKALSRKAEIKEALQGLTAQQQINVINARLRASKEENLTEQEAAIQRIVLRSVLEELKTEKGSTVTRRVKIDPKGKITRTRTTKTPPKKSNARAAAESINRIGQAFIKTLRENYGEKQPTPKPKAKKKWTPGEAKREANRLYGAGTKEARAHYDKLMGAK